MEGILKHKDFTRTHDPTGSSDPVALKKLKAEKGDYRRYLDGGTSMTFKININGDLIAIVGGR